MKLMTKELQAEFAKVGRQELGKQSIVIAHYFNPLNSKHRYFATEYFPDNNCIYGYASIVNNPCCNEWGEQSLDELENTPLQYGMKFERDLHWIPCTVAEACKQKDIYID